MEYNPIHIIALTDSPHDTLHINGAHRVNLMSYAGSMAPQGKYNIRFMHIYEVGEYDPDLGVDDFLRIIGLRIGKNEWYDHTFCVFSRGHVIVFRGDDGGVGQQGFDGNELSRIEHYYSPLISKGQAARLLEPELMMINIEARYMRLSGDDLTATASVYADFPLDSHYAWETLTPLTEYFTVEYAVARNISVLNKYIILRYPVRHVRSFTYMTATAANFHARYKIEYMARLECKFAASA